MAASLSVRGITVLQALRRVVTERGSAGSRPTGCPTNLDDYCDWLNVRERRRGRWVIVTADGGRRIDWREESGSDEWLRGKGLARHPGRSE